MKVLYKSNKDKMLLGVCGGLGEYLGIDSSIIRILWVMGSITFAGSGILLYFLMAMILPEEDKVIEENAFYKEQEDFIEHQNHSKTLGIILIVFGVLFILRKFLRFLDFQYIFPIALIALGIFLIIKGGNKHDEE
ncbi:PspC domain-containing protein [Garciella nitratireducens]|uniref:Phage shock protein C (PspC) family protein n=1 Tax=Garciella nitratireducens DSM 15102 TaxID=1121911 RepID=A0A1T4L1C1_9FIRM|nr:PspC domain-containing protein [Garciella nitratireducens]RBP40661.1 phage shock protein C (PspC) family protein [Garciella nitratireducens]SJZ48443.1 phage shock protein C (PspC) family protein [Garciella nitratireducens DSM 15102]